MSEFSYREPTEDEFRSLQSAFEEVFPFAADGISIRNFPVVIIEDYKKGDGTYQGRLGVVIDGGATPTAYCFDDDGEAFLASEVLEDWLNQ